jgi:hypothetical protein
MQPRANNSHLEGVAGKPGVQSSFMSKEVRNLARVLTRVPEAMYDTGA